MSEQANHPSAPSSAPIANYSPNSNFFVPIRNAESSLIPIDCGRRDQVDWDKFSIGEFKALVRLQMFERKKIADKRCEMNELSNNVDQLEEHQNVLTDASNCNPEKYTDINTHTTAAKTVIKMPAPIELIELLIETECDEAESNDEKSTNTKFAKTEKPEEKNSKENTEKKDADEDEDLQGPVLKAMKDTKLLKELITPIIANSPEEAESQLIDEETGEERPSFLLVFKSDENLSKLSDIELRKKLELELNTDTEICPAAEFSKILYHADSIESFKSMQNRISNTVKDDWIGFVHFVCRYVRPVRIGLEVCVENRLDLTEPDCYGEIPLRMLFEKLFMNWKMKESDKVVLDVFEYLISEREKNPDELEKIIVLNAESRCDKRANNLLHGIMRCMNQFAAYDNVRYKLIEMLVTRGQIDVSAMEIGLGLVSMEIAANLRFCQSHGVELYVATVTTPLHLAVQQGHLDLVKLFINHGADVNSHWHGKGYFNEDGKLKENFYEEPFLVNDCIVMAPWDEIYKNNLKPLDLALAADSMSQEDYYDRDERWSEIVEYLKSVGGRCARDMGKTTT